MGEGNFCCISTEESKFEVWLSGNNRQIQAEYNALLNYKDIGRFTLSQINPGFDSIIASSISEHPDFDDLTELKKQIEVKTEYSEVIKRVVRFLRDTTFRSDQDHRIH